MPMNPVIPMAEEWGRPGRSRYLDILRQSGQDLQSTMLGTGAAIGGAMQQGGTEFGRGIGQGIAGGAEGIATGMQRGFQNRMAEEQAAREDSRMAMEKRRFAKEWGAEEDDPLTPDINEAMGQRDREFNQRQEMEKNRLESERQDRIMRGERFDLEKESIQRERDEKDAIKKKKGAVNRLLSAAAAGDMMAYQSVVDQIAQDPTLDLMSIQQEAQAAHTKQKYQNELVRQNLPGYQAMLDVASEGEALLDLSHQMMDTAKKYESLEGMTMPGSVDYKTKDKLEAKYQELMSNPAVDKAHIAEALYGSTDSPFRAARSGEKAEFIKTTTQQALEDNRKRLLSRIAALPAIAQEQPEIKELKAKILEQSLGRKVERIGRYFGGGGRQRQGKINYFAKPSSSAGGNMRQVDGRVHQLRYRGVASGGAH